MKPSDFEYVAVTSLEEALSLLEEHGDEAKILAGGQSLLPMMNFRLVQPSIVIDISRIPDIDTIEETDRSLRIGAMTRHVQLKTSPLVAEHFPIVGEAMRFVAHTAIRNRGTIGGSLSHADPAAELPMIAMLLDAKMQIASKAGQRCVEAQDFFVGPLMTDLAADEVLVAVEFPLLPNGMGWGFEEVARRSGDFALAAVAAVLRVDDGKFRDVRIAAMGVSETPLRLREVERSLCERQSREFDDNLLQQIGSDISQAVEPNSDLQASADYRRHLLGVLGRRAITAALGRAQEAVR